MRLSIAVNFLTIDCVSKSAPLSSRPSQMNLLSRIVTGFGLAAFLLSPFAAERAHASEARKSPRWVRDAVVYEVFTRNFSPSGDFNGVTARLPELKNLGVTVLWLMPIH